VPIDCSVPIGRTPSAVVRIGRVRKPSGWLCPCPSRTPCPRPARTPSRSRWPASLDVEHRIVEHLLRRRRIGVELAAPGTISVKPGCVRLRRAASKPTQPDGVPPLVTSLR
jgi:hypothetical protein